MMGMDWWVPWMSLVMGVLAYIVCRTLDRFLLAQRVPKAHARYRERILERLHYHLNLQAELADCEQELAELWQQAPDQQARVIIETVERARTIPRALRSLARRFGFNVPDEAQLDELPAQPTEEASPSGQLITPTAWTGRAVGQ